MLDSGLKQEWVDALRSGDYKQGKGALRRFDDSGGYRYCCLGVLGELLVKRGEAEWEFTENLLVDGIHSTTTIPSNAAESIGLEGIYEHRDVQHELITMNDEKRLPFSEIADYIERSL